MLINILVVGSNFVILNFILSSFIRFHLSFIARSVNAFLVFLTTIGLKWIESPKRICVYLLKGIKGLDDNSIINACKLVTFDVWYRDLYAAISAKGADETNPDSATIQNICTLVKRSISFFNEYGPIIKDGFDFNPVKQNEKAYEIMIRNDKGNYGGYTATVN